MNKELALIEKNDTVQYNLARDGYGTRTVNMSIMPYDWDQKTLETINKHHIKVPFTKLVNRSEGTSECPFCSAKYAGHEVYCTNQVSEVSYEGGWNNIKVAGLVYTGDTVNGWNKGPVVVKYVKKINCDTLTSWNLSEEFEKQRKFFAFVSFLDQLDPDHKGMIQEYAQYLPAGNADQLRLSYLEITNMNLEVKIASIESALQTIAQKMNFAGHSLSF